MADMSVALAGAGIRDVAVQYLARAFGWCYAGGITLQRDFSWTMKVSVQTYRTMVFVRRRGSVSWRFQKPSRRRCLIVTGFARTSDGEQLPAKAQRERKRAQ